MHTECRNTYTGIHENSVRTECLTKELCVDFSTEKIVSLINCFLRWATAILRNIHWDPRTAQRSNTRTTEAVCIRVRSGTRAHAKRGLIRSLFPLYYNCWPPADRWISSRLHHWLQSLVLSSQSLFKREASGATSMHSQYITQPHGVLVWIAVDIFWSRNFQRRSSSTRKTAGVWWASLCSD